MCVWGFLFLFFKRRKKDVDQLTLKLLFSFSFFLSLLGKIKKEYLKKNVLIFKIERSRIWSPEKLRGVQVMSSSFAFDLSVSRPSFAASPGSRPP